MADAGIYFTLLKNSFTYLLLNSNIGTVKQYLVNANTYDFLCPKKSPLLHLI